MNFFNQLSDQLQKSAYLAAGEAAWSRENAVQVIDCLSKMGLAVCRIEVWLPTVPGPTIPVPFIYTWEPDTEQYRRDRTEPAVVQWMNEKATTYITAFKWDKDDAAHLGAVPYFNLEVYDSD